MRINVIRHMNYQHDISLLTYGIPLTMSVYLDVWANLCSELLKASSSSSFIFFLLLFFCFLFFCFLFFCFLFFCFLFFCFLFFCFLFFFLLPTMRNPLDVANG